MAVYTTGNGKETASPSVSVPLTPGSGETQPLHDLQLATNVRSIINKFQYCIVLDTLRLALLPLIPTMPREVTPALVVTTGPTPLWPELDGLRGLCELPSVGLEECSAERWSATWPATLGPISRPVSSRQPVLIPRMVTTMILMETMKTMRSNLTRWMEARPGHHSVGRDCLSL